jgi:tripartite-type tricarboxylate transporter receptor subunit TctC
MNWSRSRTRQAAVAAALFVCIMAASAHEWPKQRPVTIVVSTAPGALIDTLARIIGQKVGESLGQTFVADNRPGAGGNIATQRVARAAPDGYTLLIAAANFVINPSLYSNGGYDPIKDFIPVILIGTTPTIISVHPSVPATNLQELVELARKQPLFYASPGVGTSAQLSMERIKSRSRIDITHVPTQPAQAVMSTLSAQTPVLIISAPLQLPHVKAGKLRALAVTSARRWPSLPDVPTVDEQGMKGIDDVAWFGIFAPAGISNVVVDLLNVEINRVMAMPDIKEKVGQLGLDFQANTAAEFARFVKDEVPKWAQAVKDSGAKAD